MQSPKSWNHDLKDFPPELLKESGNSCRLTSGEIGFPKKLVLTAREGGRPPSQIQKDGRKTSGNQSRDGCGERSTNDQEAAASRREEDVRSAGTIL
jgi:hypothetical protein